MSALLFLRRLALAVTLTSLGSFGTGCGEAELVQGGALDLQHDYREVPEEFQLEQALGASGRAVIYINFEGQRLRYGGSSSKQNTSWILPQGWTVDIPAFHTGTLGGMNRAQAIARIVDYVRHDYRHWDAVITTQRPTSGDYTMVMVGGHPSLIGEHNNTVGIAPLDYGNPNRNDVVFVFSESIYDLRQVASCISHEAAHSFGLDHVEPQSALMYPTLLPGTLTFQNARVWGKTYFQDQPRILHGLFGSPTGTPPPTLPSPPPQQQDASVYVSQEIPSTLTPGETFLARVTFRNAGTTTWTAGADYGLMAPDSTWGGNHLALGANVAPGQTRTFTFYAQAPSQPGAYTFQWFVTRGGQRFGAASPATTLQVQSTQNRLPHGQFEFADGTWGYGWAWDPDVPSAAIHVDVYVNGQYRGSVKADRNRDDLGRFGVVGRAHGFAFQMPALGPGTHKVEVYAVDHEGQHAYKLPGDFFVSM